MSVRMVIFRVLPSACIIACIELRTKLTITC